MNIFDNYDREIKGNSLISKNYDIENDTMIEMYILIVNVIKIVRLEKFNNYDFNDKTKLSVLYITSNDIKELVKITGETCLDFDALFNYSKFDNFCLDLYIKKQNENKSFKLMN